LYAIHLQTPALTKYANLFEKCAERIPTDLNPFSKIENRNTINALHAVRLESMKDARLVAINDTAVAALIQPRSTVTCANKK